MEEESWPAAIICCSSKLQSSTHLCHLLSVGFGVQGSLCEQHRVLLRGYSQLIVESVMPDLLHIIPVGDNTVFNGVLQGQDTSFALGFITNIAVFLAHTNHHTLQNKDNVVSTAEKWITSFFQS